MFQFTSKSLQSMNSSITGANSKFRVSYELEYKLLGMLPLKKRKIDMYSQYSVAQLNILISTWSNMVRNCLTATNRTDFKSFSSVSGIQGFSDWET